MKLSKSCIECGECTQEDLDRAVELIRDMDTVSGHVILMEGVQLSLPKMLTKLQKISPILKRVKDEFKNISIVNSRNAKKLIKSVKDSYALKMIKSTIEVGEHSKKPLYAYNGDLIELPLVGDLSYILLMIIVEKLDVYKRDMVFHVLENGIRSKLGIANE